MFGLGFPELLLIFVIALVVFGPKKLPEMGRSIGRALAEFKKASEEFQESIKAEMKEVEKASPLEELKKIGQDATDAAKQASAPETAPTEQDKEKEKKEKVDGNV